MGLKKKKFWFDFPDLTAQASQVVILSLDQSPGDSFVKPAKFRESHQELPVFKRNRSLFVNCVCFSVLVELDVSPVNPLQDIENVANKQLRWDYKTNKQTNKQTTNGEGDFKRAFEIVVCHLRLGSEFALGVNWGAPASSLAAEFHRWAPFVKVPFPASLAQRWEGPMKATDHKQRTKNKENKVSFNLAHDIDLLIPRKADLGLTAKK